MEINRKKGLQLFGLYFATMFSTSLFVNTMILPTPTKGILDEERMMQGMAIGAVKTPSVQIEHKDITGLKNLVKRQRRQNESRRQQMEEQAWRQEQAIIAQSRMASLPRTVAAAAPVQLDPNDQHPVTPDQSANFVPFDSDIPVIPIKVKGTLSEEEKAKIREQIPSLAKKYIGVPYVYAGKTPRGFDCSGYTSYVMGLFGIGITGSSRHQAVLGKPVNVKEVKTGDLVFFSRYGKGGRVTHVALVLDNVDGRVTIIHANGPGIMVEDLFSSKYWVPKLLFARNIIDAL
jgi:cell wall-associated NlpC family hydrolase